MSKAIIHNDVIDVIYDTIYGYTIEEAHEILYKYRYGQLIPADYIEEKINDYYYISARATTKASQSYLNDIQALKSLLRNWKTFGEGWLKKNGKE